MVRLDTYSTKRVDNFCVELMNSLAYSYEAFEKFDDLQCGVGNFICLRTKTGASVRIFDSDVFSQPTS